MGHAAMTYQASRPQIMNRLSSKYYLDGSYLE